MHFHVSDLKSFSDCRLKWSFASHMRHGRAPKTAAPALRLGTFVHKCLERWYEQPWKSPEVCIAEAVESLEGADPPPGASDILRNYILWAEENDDFEVLAVEQDFAVPIHGGEHQFAGRWDLVTLKNGKYWLNDFKITGMPFESYAQYLSEFDEQARGYCWAGYQIYGQEFGGIMFTLVKNKPPEQPVTLLNGQMSRSKSQKTSWQMYKAALNQLGLPVHQYDDMKQHFNANPFVFRLTMTVNDRAHRAFEQRLHNTSLEMLNPDVLIYPNANPITCRMCSYQLPCTVYHSVDEETAHRILFTEYAPSRYAQEALDEDKADLNSPVL